MPSGKCKFRPGLDRLDRRNLLRAVAAHILHCVDLLAAVRAHADGIKKQLARLAPDVIVLNHRPAPDDTPARQARAIANALDACEKIAPNAEVYLVANIDPGEFAAAYRAALEYRRERDRRTR